jgi:hypothetical protein
LGTIGEGYGICDNTTSTGYFAYADFGDSGNWGPATVLNVNSSSVKIKRTTSDGVFTLTQTISQSEGSQAVRVQMSLKNNSSTDRSVFFMRYADVDVSGTSNNNFDATANSAFRMGFVGQQHAAVWTDAAERRQHERPDADPVHPKDRRRSDAVCAQ